MTITVVGLGLIGGSLALGLRETGFASRLIGVDSQPEHLAEALALGLVDEAMPLAKAVHQSELVILATPVDALLTLLPRVLDLTDRQVVIEVGSTKRQAVAAVRGHARRGRLVATHPMAGTEFSGPQAAVRGLFAGKCCVFCDVADSDPVAVELARRLYAALGMRITEMSAADHDVHTAYVSHISHICSFALAATVLEKEKEEARIFELASGGFGSTVRLAKSSPDTWVPIFRQNRDNLLEVLDEYITTLLTFKGLLLSDSYDTLHQKLAQANDIIRVLKEKG